MQVNNILAYTILMCFFVVIFSKLKHSIFKRWGTLETEEENESYVGLDALGKYKNWSPPRFYKWQ